MTLHNISSHDMTTDETTPGNEGDLHLRDAALRGRHNEREGTAVTLVELAQDRHQGRNRKTERIASQLLWPEV
jgi:hypothetical protein